MLHLPSLMPALITPFTDGGEIDWEAHLSNVASLDAAGIEGFVLGGSNGEGPFLNPAERRRLVSETLPSGQVVIGIWSESVRQALESIEACAEAHAALVATPTTLARNDPAVQIRFFDAIADRSPIPVLLYSVPRNTGYSLHEAAVNTLSEHPNIAGMKDSGGDAVRLERMIGNASAGFAVFNGASTSTRLAMLAGAAGVITASVNYLTDAMRRLVESDWTSAESRDLQRQVTVVSGAVERFGVPGVKVAARIAGLDPGWVREPLVALHQTDELAIRRALEDFLNH